MQSFITKCGNYGVFSYGKQWMVVYHNEQLEVFKTQNQCKKFIEKHRQTLNPTPVTPKKPTRRRTTTASKTVPAKKPTPKKSTKINAVTPASKTKTPRKTKK